MKGSSAFASSSSDASKKPSVAAKGAAFGRRKKPASVRGRLPELNGAVSGSRGTNASCSSSISSSVEAPRGCLRFFLPNSSVSKPKTPLINRYRAQSGAPKSGLAQKSKKNSNPPRHGGKVKTCSVSGNVGTGTLRKSQGQKTRKLDSGGVRADNLTPVSKLLSVPTLGLGGQLRSDENSDVKENKIMTPPIEASVSPEIQCSNLKMLSTVKISSGIASPQPCYGAGHVLSGIPDKRKCKPRGILTVIECDSETNNALTNADAAYIGSDSGVVGFGKTSGLSPVPMPCEASMHWLSPCYEKGEEDQKDKSPTHELDGSVSMSLCSSSPSLSGTTFSSDVFCKSSLTSSGTDASSGNSNSRNPSSVLRGSWAQIFSSPMSKEGKESRFYVERDDTRFMNSGSASKNPQEDQLDCEPDLVSQAFGKVTISPEHHSHRLSTWDPAILSFRQDYMNNPFNSIDMAQVQKAVDEKSASWVSNSTSDFIPSQDPLRISWRDGLVSRIFEMDEFDCCRCFSDEENGSNKKLNDRPNPDQSGGIRDNAKLQTDLNLKTDPHVHSMSLESLSSNGSHLNSSDDSTWNLCYKNHLFAA